ncbi:hypothetical protein BKA70DRAFT_1237672 [Coprinopsis sp. MPI-PUGE-AT-0042]|nr:hypothetical protein BKA70DRAFT_1237672 [Coprinopsis sp. MPI-PUGE-AT-0042]
MLEGPSSKEALPAVIIFLVIMTPGIGVQFLMCLYALRNFQQKPTDQRDGKRRRLLAFSFAIWMIYSAAVLIEVWNIVCRMLGRDAYPLWSLAVNTALTTAYMCAGDCLMLWRCWIIWNGKRWVALVPIILFLPYFALTPIKQFLQPSESSRSSTASPATYHQSLGPSVVFSVATNIAITSLIIYKLLVARQEVIKSEMYDSVPRFYRDLIVILVESAAPLALAGVCAVAVSAARLSKDRQDESMPGLYLSVLAFNLFFLLFGALSPQMILLRTLVCPPKESAVLATEEGDTETDVGAVFTTQSAQFPHEAPA